MPPEDVPNGVPPSPPGSPPPQRRRRFDPRDRDSRPVPPDAPDIPTPLNDAPGDEGDIPPPPDDWDSRRAPIATSRQVRPGVAEAESQRRLLQSVNEQAMGLLVDGNVPDRLIRGRIRGNEQPLMAVIRAVLEEETGTVRRIGITDRLAKEIGARALGTLIARNDAGCVKSAIWLAEHFTAPQLIPFQQTVGGMAQPQVTDALRQTLESLGVPPQMAGQVMQQIQQNQAVQRRQAATENLAADPDLLQRFAEGEGLLPVVAMPVVLDGDNGNVPLLPPDLPGSENDDDEDDE